MKLRYTDLIHINRHPVRAHHLLFIAILLSIVTALPAQLAAQAPAPTPDDPRVNLSINVGEAFDRFGYSSRQTGAVGAVDGEVVFYKSPDRDRGADAVVGGEVRFPQDTNNHAQEQAIYVGPKFHFGKNLTLGAHIQLHRIVLPPEITSGSLTSVFNRDRMEMVEVPGFIEYKFGPSHNFFVRAEGGIEFAPHWKNPPAVEPFPHPQLDHGYTIRGVLGYNFGRWYVKGTYQTRYFKFNPNVGNPDLVYNWRSDFITAGAGIRF